MQIRVYYEDTDCGGIVYHSQYLNFCERARSETFFAKGLMPGGDQSGFVVKKIECDFKASAKLGDQLQVQSSLLECKNSSFWLLQTIYKDNLALFEGRFLLAYIKEGKLARIDRETKTLITQLF
ncbi:MAG: YbgC/FadM family acyl-CoA thioesterase [Campylobacterota bacterium]